MDNTANYFIVPGLGNSGPEHWQSYFERSGNNFKRINQLEWDAPDCDVWIAEIDRFIADYDLETVVLIGHSSGCAAIVHWANKYKRNIRGAMIVGPTDVDLPKYKEFNTTGFAPMPLGRISFKTIVVASSNDPWASLERAEFFADSWDSEFIDIGEAGHINTEAGFGEWEEGLEILKWI